MGCSKSRFVSSRVAAIVFVVVVVPPWLIRSVCFPMIAGSTVLAMPIDRVVRMVCACRSSCFGHIR